MLNSKLLTLGTAVVLTLGLGACSPDKKTDTWSVDAPQISIKAGSQVGFTDKSPAEPMPRDWTPSLREMSHRVLPANADVVFPSLMDVDSSATPFDVIVDSDCTFGLLHRSEKKSLHHAARFSLQTLIPSDLTVTTLSSATFYKCSLSLGVTNQYGSVETFTLPEVYIQNLDQVSQIPIETFDTHQAVDDSIPVVNYADAHRYVLNDTGSMGASTVQLVCDLHVRTASYSDLNEFHLDDLLPIDDPANPLWRQTCRLLVTPTGHPEKMKLSKRIILTKPTPAIDLKRLGIPCSDFLNQTAMSLAVTNSSNQTQIIGLKIPKYLHYAASGHDNFANFFNLKLTTQVKQTETVTDANGVMWLSLAPSATTEVSVTTDQGINSQSCPQNDYYLTYEFSDSGQMWPQGLDPSVNWGHGNPAQLVQTGHYASLSEIHSQDAGIADVSSPTPLAVVYGVSGSTMGSISTQSKLPSY